MISFFPENNGLLLQLNTFATQHFCKPTFLQYKAFATRLVCNSYFCNSTLLKFVPLVPFSSIAFRSGVFVHMFFFQLFVQKLAFHLTHFFRSIYGQQFLCSFLLMVIVSSFADIASPSSPQSLQKSRRHWHKPWTNIICIFFLLTFFFVGCLPGWVACLGGLPI